MDVILDLFGDPTRAPGTRGRPQHVATRENRNKVNMLLALGWSNERIAAALQVTQPTLRKHYFQELKVREVARDRLDARLAMLLWDQCEAGNVGALREFQKLVDRNDTMFARADFYDGQRKSNDEAPVEKLGKKEIAARDAAQAGKDTEWADDLRPRTH